MSKYLLRDEDSLLASDILSDTFPDPVPRTLHVVVRTPLVGEDSGHSDNDRADVPPDIPFQVDLNRHTHAVDIESTSFQPRGSWSSINLNQCQAGFSPPRCQLTLTFGIQQKPPQIDSVTSNDAVVIDASMDGVDGSDLMEFPDNNTDSEPMLIDLRTPDVDGDPERAGYQGSPSGNHEVSTQTSPVRKISRDSGTHEHSPTQSPTNARYCWVNLISRSAYFRYGVYLICF